MNLVLETVGSINFNDINPKIFVIYQKSGTIEISVPEDAEFNETMAQLGLNIKIRAINGTPIEHMILHYNASEEINLQNIDKRILHWSAPNSPNPVSDRTMYIPKDRANTIIAQLKDNPNVTNIICGGSMRLPSQQKIAIPSQAHDIVFYLGTRSIPIPEQLPAKKETQLKEIIEQLSSFEAKENVFHHKAKEQDNPLKKDNYLKAERSVKNISTQFRSLINHYVYESDQNLASFKKKFKELTEDPTFQKELEILNTHRDIKQDLVNILTIIFSLGTSLLYSLPTGNFTIFKVNTDSVNAWVNTIKPLSKLDEKNDEKEEKEETKTGLQKK